MQEAEIKELLIKNIKEYAYGRKSNVLRGTETPRFASLLLQKYGVGVIETINTIFDNRKLTNEIYSVLDEEVAKIDPKWDEHNKERWKGSPVDFITK